MVPDDLIGDDRSKVSMNYIIYDTILERTVPFPREANVALVLFFPDLSALGGKNGLAVDARLLPCLLRGIAAIWTAIHGRSLPWADPSINAPNC